MLDIAQATNAAAPTPIAGQTYPVRQLTLAEWGSLSAWLKSRTPNPVRVAAEAVAEAKALGRPFAQPIVDGLYAQAQAEARSYPPPVTSIRFLEALWAVPGGEAEFVRAVLAAGGTAVTPEEAQQIADATTPEDSQGFVRAARFGGPPLPPKAETPAATTETPTPTTAGASATGAGSSTGSPGGSVTATSPA